MKRILVCTDGSTHAEVSCQYAAWLAKQQDVEIHFLYVTDLRQYELPLVADISGSIGAQPYQNLVSQLQELENAKAEAIEQSARKVLEQAGAQVEPVFHHKSGMLVDHIEDMEENYDLILIGKRGMSADAASAHLGSSLERVLRASKKPCLVTPRAFKPIETVLVAYDGGPSVRKAVAFLSRSALFRSTSIQVLCVEEKDTAAPEKHVDEATRQLTEAGLRANGRVLRGPVEDSIAAATEQAVSPLLVMGAYGHSRIRHLFVGSTTTELLRTKHVPILCFR